MVKNHTLTKTKMAVGGAMILIALWALLPPYAIPTEIEFWLGVGLMGLYTSMGLDTITSLAFTACTITIIILILLCVGSFLVGKSVWRCLKMRRVK